MFQMIQSLALAYFHAANARIVHTTAAQTHTVRAILLRSRKPLPVPVTAQTIARMAMNSRRMLMICGTVCFFKRVTSFRQFTFSS